jgi:hypothetical protein
MVRLNVLGSAHSQGMSPDCSQHLSLGFPNITPTGFQVEVDRITEGSFCGHPGKLFLPL